ncbi:LysR family transcriptional regulator [Rhodobacteraceae bacterium M382]|nr:LysR family transcriptional regulator [Rhodobacteraceae bacterium M382]
MSGLQKLLPSANALLVFEVAARLQSFKAAALELNVTQPSISHTIKSMEAHLGVQLFERGNRGVRLTKAGAELNAVLTPALAQIEDRLRNISGHDSQTITIAASTSVAAQWLLPLTAIFQRAHPGINVRIMTTDRNVEPGNEVDLTIRRGLLNWSRPNSWMLCREELYTICSPAYLERAGPVRGLEDLKNHAIIHNAEPFRNRMTWQGWLKCQGFEGPELPETLVLNDYQLALQACLAGEGIALGWSITSKNLVDTGILVRPLCQEIHTDYGFYMIGPKALEISRARMKYVNWLRENV